MKYEGLSLSHFFVPMKSSVLKLSHCTKIIRNFTIKMVSDAI